MQSGEWGEVRLGDKQDNREKREAFDADSRKLGERSDYLSKLEVLRATSSVMAETPSVF